jgi:hypothetical protein
MRNAAVFSYNAFLVGYSETDPLPLSGKLGNIGGEGKSRQ